MSTSFFNEHSIDELELSTRVHRALWNDEKDTVEKIRACSDAELLRMPNFGRKSLRELKLALEAWDARSGEHRWVPPVMPTPHREFLLLAGLLVEIRDLLKFIKEKVDGAVS